MAPELQNQRRHLQSTKIKMHASIIIPTYNGAEDIKKCLRACLNQVTDFNYEIVLVDSSSTDGTQEYLNAITQKHSNIVVEIIKQSDFGHGKTRNLGASIASGEFLCFITQDAIPADQFWLQNLVSGLASHPNAAGAFGRHLAQEGHSAYTKSQLDTHFSGFGDKTNAYKMDSLEHYEADTAYRQKLHYYSDNNSCMRREIWEKIPYADVVFGEDQIWADAIIRAGYEKLYIPNAIVYHSHEFGLKESYLRSKEEAHFFASHFGYKLKKDIASVIKTTFYLANKEFKFTRKNQSIIQAILRYPGNVAKYTACMIGQYVGTGKQASIDHG